MTHPAGTLLALIAMTALADVLRLAGDRIWSAVGNTLFVVGATLWLFCVAFRVTVTVRVADSVGLTAEVPAAYMAAHELTAAAFGTFMVLSYLAMASYGVALRSTALLGSAVGRFAIAFGLVALPGLATPIFQPPLMVFVVPFVFGVGVLRARR